VFSLIDDIAALSVPDGQELYDRHGQYQSGTASGLTLGKPPVAIDPYTAWTLDTPPVAIEPGPEMPAWMLSLDCKWQPCTVRNRVGRLLTVCQGDGAIQGGMSGSPIIDINGSAIGLVSMGSIDGVNMHPIVMDCLPPWCCGS
jgi:hypothetical protein